MVDPFFDPFVSPRTHDPSVIGNFTIFTHSTKQRALNALATSVSYLGNIPPEPNQAIWG
jgi:hypothetical protein